MAYAARQTILVLSGPSSSLACNCLQGWFCTSSIDNEKKGRIDSFHGAAVAIALAKKDGVIWSPTASRLKCCYLPEVSMRAKPTPEVSRVISFSTSSAALLCEESGMGRKHLSLKMFTSQAWRQKLGILSEFDGQ